MNVLLVDRFQIIRHAAKALLRQLLERPLIYESASFYEMVDQLSLHSFDLTILDAQLPGQDGFELIKMIRKRQGSARILVFADCEERIYGLHYLHAGAHGFVPKSSDAAGLCESIKSVMETGRYLSSTTLKRRDRPYLSDFQ
nr:response regulator transcription factor [uncultured Dyadobacter sp.]